MAKKHARQEADNFSIITGINPAIESRLHEKGIVTYAKLASLNPNEILSIIGNINGVTVKRINKEDWTAQARKLSLRSAIAKSREEIVAGENFPVSFAVELLVDEGGHAKRTRVLHVATNQEGSWPGWDERKLLDFIVKRAGLCPPAVAAELPTASSAEQQRKSTLPPDAIPALTTTHGSAPSSDQPIEPRTAPIGIVAPIGRLSLREFETIPVDSKTSSWVLQSDQQFDVRLTLDFKELEYLKKTPLNYKATLYAKNLKSRRRQPVGETQGSMVPTDNVTINIENVHLPGGSYRLQAVVGLTAPTSEPEQQPYSILQSRGKLLEVY